MREDRSVGASEMSEQKPPPNRSAGRTQAASRGPRIIASLERAGGSALAEFPSEARQVSPRESRALPKASVQVALDAFPEALAMPPTTPIEPGKLPSPRKASAIVASCRAGAAGAGKVQREAPASPWTRRHRVAMAAYACTSVGGFLLTMVLWGGDRPAGPEPPAAADGFASVELAGSQPAQAPMAPVPAAVKAAPQKPALKNTPSRSSNVRLQAAASGRDNPRGTTADSDLSGLVVTTEPEGARVTVNGVGWGTTPLTIPLPPGGTKRIRVTRAGYQTEERVVRDAAIAEGTLRIVLREVPEGPR